MTNIERLEAFESLLPTFRETVAAYFAPHALTGFETNGMLCTNARFNHVFKTLWEVAPHEAGSLAGDYLNAVQAAAAARSLTVTPADVVQILPLDEVTGPGGVSPAAFLASYVRQ